MGNTAIPSTLGTTVTGALSTLASSTAGVTLDLLWTNPNTSANFPATSITVTAGYKLYYLSFKYISTSSDDESTHPAYTCLLLAGHSCHVFFLSYGTGGVALGQRTITCVSNPRVIKISAADGNQSHLSNCLIPKFIYGIK